MIKKTITLFILTSLVFGCATMNKVVDPALGTWDHHLENLPQGNPNGKFTISKEGDIYTGALHGERGVLELKEIVIEGNRLVSSHFFGQGYQIEMTGVFEGDTFTGQIDAEGNVFKMTAVRSEQ